LGEFLPLQEVVGYHCGDFTRLVSYYLNEIESYLVEIGLKVVGIQSKLVVILLKTVEIVMAS
jgi:hypothetical protein